MQFSGAFRKEGKHDVVDGQDHSLCFFFYFPGIGALSAADFSAGHDYFGQFALPSSAFGFMGPVGTVFQVLSRAPFSPEPVVYDKRIHSL